MTRISRMGEVARQNGPEGWIDDQVDPLLDRISGGDADAAITIRKCCNNGRKGPAQPHVPEYGNNVGAKHCIIRLGEGVSRMFRLRWLDSTD
jgi:hypothetical protein